MVRQLFVMASESSYLWYIFPHIFASTHDEIYNLCNRQSRPIYGQTGLLSFFDVMMLSL